MAERDVADAVDIRSQLAGAVAAAKEPDPVETAAPIDKPVVEDKPALENPKSLQAKVNATKDSKEPKEPKEAPKPKSEDPKDALSVPSNWPENRKAALEKLAKVSPDDAKWIIERHKEMEADYTRKTQEVAAQRKEYDTIDKIFVPYEQQMKQAGWTKASLIEAWSGVEKALMDPGQRADIVARIVNAYKIDPTQIMSKLGLQANTSAAPKAESELPPWQKEIQDLKAQVNGFGETEKQRQMAEYNAKAQRVQSEIDQFRDAKNDDGLLHPHFADVEQDMVKLVSVYQARGETVPTLDKLYEDAVWANPSTRAKMLEAQKAAVVGQSTAAQQEAERKRNEEARAKAEKAKRAGKSVTGAPGSGATPARRTEALSLRDTIKANLAEVNSTAA